MSDFAFGFVRGFALPAYLALGICRGVQIGLRLWRRDTHLIRRATTEAQP